MRRCDGALIRFWSIINDILDFSKIESGKMRLEITDFDLREVLGDALRALAIQASKKGLELMYQVNPNVPGRLEGDPHRMSQILINLVGNAIKFTEKGEIVVRVKEEDRAGGRSSLLWSVNDTGMGIPRETQKLIFEAFTQADVSTTRKHGGTGLGLSITTQLLRMMGGRIWVESEPGVGSTFFFTTDLGVGKDEGSEPDAGPGSLKGVPILIVDDNATNRDFLCEATRLWGMAPRAVAGPREALADLERGPKHYPVMILDAQMPVMSGLQLAQEIAQRHLLDGGRVIFLASALERPAGDIADAIWIDKPVKDSELREAVLAALQEQPLSEHQVEEFRKKEKNCEPAAHVVSRRLRILLAEDNPVNQELAVGILQACGHIVTLASNGREAADLYRAKSFDVVLMDVQMPEMDGYASTAEIRSIESQSGRRTPVIAMTAHALDGDREKCLAAGMDAYVSKPIRAALLLDTITTATNSTQENATPASQKKTGNPKDVLDFDEALKQCLDDRRLLARLLTQFLQQLGPMQTAIEQALMNGELEALARTAHTFKGSAGAIAARRSFAKAADLEQAARSGNKEKAKSIYAKLSAEIAELSATIEQTLKNDITS